MSSGTELERLDASDPIDQAAALEELHFRVSLANQQNSRRVLPPKLAEVEDKKLKTKKIMSLCYYCDAELDDVNPDTDHVHVRRFCDEDCRNDWQHEEDMKVRTGRKKGDYRNLPGLKGRVGTE